MGHYILASKVFLASVPLITPLSLTEWLLNGAHIVFSSMQLIFTKNWRSLGLLTRLVYDISYSLCIYVFLKHVPIAYDGLWKHFWVPPPNPAHYDLPNLHFNPLLRGGTLIMALQSRVTRIWTSVSLHSRAEVNRIHSILNPTLKNSSLQRTLGSNTDNLTY